MKKQAKFRPIAPPQQLFTKKQMRRLMLMKWLIAKGRVSEWKV